MPYRAAATSDARKTKNQSASVYPKRIFFAVRRASIVVSRVCVSHAQIYAEKRKTAPMRRLAIFIVSSAEYPEQFGPERFDRPELTAEGLTAEGLVEGMTRSITLRVMVSEVEP